MVLDSSAVVAILSQELGFEALLTKIEAAETVAVGTPTLVECIMVLSSRLTEDPRVAVEALMRRLNVQIVPFTVDHYDAASEAFRRFGRKRHAAALNYGDCMSYAIAALAGMPLLFTGKDFARTDIRAA